MSVGVNPIMVGRNSAPTTLPQFDATAFPQAQATFSPENIPVQQPTVQPTAQPVLQPAPAATTTAVAPMTAQVQSGCNMYFNIKQITRIVLEMPWAFLHSDFDVAFVSNMGELVVSEVPPMYDESNDIFVLENGVKSLVLGTVSDDFRKFWRESVSFRPDSGFTEEDVETVKAKKEEPATVAAPTPARLVDNTDYSGMSRNQRKRIKKNKLALGTKFEDLPQLLRDA